jgi:hypothetical protein
MDEVLLLSLLCIPGFLFVLFLISQIYFSFLDYKNKKKQMEQQDNILKLWKEHLAMAEKQKILGSLTVVKPKLSLVKEEDDKPENKGESPC